VVPLELIREFERQMKALRIGNTSMKELRSWRRSWASGDCLLKLEGDIRQGPTRTGRRSFMPGCQEAGVHDLHRSQLRQLRRCIGICRREAEH